MAAWWKLLLNDMDEHSDMLSEHSRRMDEHHVRAARTEEALAQVVRSLKHLETNLMQTIKDVLDQVTAENTVIAGAVTLINGLKSKLDALAAQPSGASQEDLKSLSDAIAQGTGPLAAAVTANTIAPSAPAVVNPTAPTPAPAPTTNSAG